MQIAVTIDVDADLPRRVDGQGQEVRRHDGEGLALRRHDAVRGIEHEAELLGLALRAC